jgi:hypothetical protein
MGIEAMRSLPQICREEGIRMRSHNSQMGSSKGTPIELACVVLERIV